MIELGPKKELDFKDFYAVVSGESKVKLSEDCLKRLDKVVDFVENHLIKENIKVYGITTGFADLRNYCVDAKKAKQLSHNIINSHDAGIGKSLPENVIVGAMLIRANALCKGHSGFKKENLQVLIDMINKRIIPYIPEHGSLGASGDLAMLARLGRAMEGQEVPVFYKGKTTTAKAAMEAEKITPAVFVQKEGLALTNGTSFLTSLAVISFIAQIHMYENIFALQGLFLNSYRVVDCAFYSCIQNVRKNTGQKKVAEILIKHLKNSPFVDKKGIQNDYLIRCMPQIFSYLVELFPRASEILINEMNAVTDNPLIFNEKEITDDVDKDRIFTYRGEKWAVISGGNFHGEPIAQICDSLRRINVKPIRTLEKQMTYMLNPSRHGLNSMPTYLVPDKTKLGLSSGFMIVQYTANAIAQKISFDGIPVSIFNITSGNESEDVVSYATTSANKLLDQLKLMKDFMVCWFTEALQAYAIARKEIKDLKKIEDMISEKVFKTIETIKFPLTEDQAFDEHYKKIHKYLNTGVYRKIMNFPLNSECPKDTDLSKLL